MASLCLFMIEDDVEAEKRELDLFKLTAPPGVRSQVRLLISEVQVGSDAM